MAKRCSLYVHKFVLGFVVPGKTLPQLFRAWLRHGWSSPEFHEVREAFCEPRSAADEQCKGGPLNMPTNWTINRTLTTEAGEPIRFVDRDPSDFDVKAWCKWYYNETGCSDIYEAAVSRCAHQARDNVHLVNIASFVNMLLLALCLWLTMSIVTPAVLMKYMSTKVNAMLALPGAAVLLIGLYLMGDGTMGFLDGSQRKNDSEIDFRQIEPEIVELGKLYSITALLIIFLCMIGLDREMLRNKFLLRAYTFGLALTLVFLAIEGIWCIRISESIEDSLTYVDWEGGAYACRTGLYGCSNCESEDAVTRCPEWSKRDIIQNIRVYLGVSGLVAVTSMIYIIAGLFSAITLVKKLREYRCEYV